MANSIGRNTIINSLLWKFLERGFSQGINLVVQIILARILFPKDFGALAILVSITNYLGLFVQSGLSTAIIQKKNLEENDVSTLLTSSLVVALVLYIILFFLAPWIADIYVMPHLIWPLRVLALILFFNAINSIQIAILSRRMDFKSIFIRTAIAVPISGIVGIVMAYMGCGLWSLVVHNVVNIVVLVVVMFFTSDFRLQFGFSWQHAKSLYSFAIKILFTNLISGFGDTLRTMLIGKQYTPAQLAYYDKAYTYSAYATNIVGATIQSVMLPAFSQSQDNCAKLKSMARRSVKISAFIMIPFLAGVAICAKPLVLLLLTDKWAPCIPFLMLFCVFRMPSCISVIDKQVFYAMGKSGIGFYFEMGLIIFNILSLIITLPIGVGAVAIGATIVELLGCMSLFIIAHKVYNYTLWERCLDLLKPVINSTIMVVSMWIILRVEWNYFPTLCSQIFVGIVVYIIFAYITKDNNLSYVINVLMDKIKTIIKK